MRQSQEIHDLVQGFGTAIRSNQTEAAIGLIAPDAGIVWIGTDPDEYWVGHERVAAMYREQMEVMGDAVSVTDLRVEAYETTSEAGWFAGRTSFTTPQGEVKVRISGAVARLEGEWKIVQFHSSVGIPNEETVGQELPT